MARRPVYWAAMFLLPLFVTLLLTSMMEEGLPDKVPAAIIDKDGSKISRRITQNLGSMQEVDLVDESNSFTEARHKMQEGKIFGFSYSGKFRARSSFRQGAGDHILYQHDILCARVVALQEFQDYGLDVEGRHHA